MQKNIKIFLKNILYQIIKNNFNIIQIHYIYMQMVHIIKVSI
jgi:hypothetical protein